jgi:hypothetical protein
LIDEELFRDDRRTFQKCCLHQGEIEVLMREILVGSSKKLSCGCCNSWLFEEEQSKLVSLLACTSSTHLFSNEASLSIVQLP